MKVEIAAEPKLATKSDAKLDAKQTAERAEKQKAHVRFLAEWRQDGLDQSDRQKSHR